MVALSRGKQAKQLNEQYDDNEEENAIEKKVYIRI